VWLLWRQTPERGTMIAVCVNREGCRFAIEREQRKAKRKAAAAAHAALISDGP
jgi:hypothetical protein